MATETAEPVTPSQAGAATAAQVVADRLAEHEKRLSDSLDIRDPSVPREPAPAETPKSSTQQPQMIAGASADGGITSDLLDRAVQVGISLDDAKAYTPASLLKTIGLLESRQYEPEYYEPEPQQQQSQWTPEGYIEQLQSRLPPLGAEDGMEVDSKLAASIYARDQAYQQELAQLHQQNQQILAQQQQAQAAQQRRESEQQYRSLESLMQKDADYKDVLGEGPAASLVGTRHHIVRSQIANTMDDLAAGYQRRGQVVPDTETLYAKAKVVVVGDRAAVKQQQTTIERLRARNGQFIAPPTATTRNREDGTPTDRAVRAVAAKLRERTAY